MESLSARLRRLVTKPVSYLPSVDATSQPLTVTLPYLTVHRAEFFVAIPLHLTPRGMTHMFDRRSSSRSILRPTRMSFRFVAV